nr:unnamed protein product [Digitaria exilis]
MASSQCCDNPPALNPDGGEGKVVDSFGGLKAYLAGSDESKAAAILISDVYAHGWSVRYNHDDVAAVKSAEEALQDTIKWFNTNLK